MRRKILLGIKITVYQLMMISFLLGVFNLPQTGRAAQKTDIFTELESAVKHELHIVEYTKNIGYNTTEESAEIVIGYDDIISDAAEKFDVPKQMIQAVLFKELRMIDFRDGISDIFVDKCFKAHRRLIEKTNRSIFTDTLACLTNTKGSSTGIGQIFPETAIKAYNWYIKDNEFPTECVNCNDIGQREYMWRALQDDKTSIFFVALILKYEAEFNLGIDISGAKDKDIKALFTRYNGAGYYGDEVFNYYSVFNKMKSA